MKTQPLRLNRSFRTTPHVPGIVPGLLLLTLLTGCADPPVTETVARPVRTFRVGEHAGAGSTSYAGEVKARYETRLSFRVSGKMVARYVDVGDRVKKGQLIAELDPSDYQLAAQGLTAQLAAARAERDFAKDDVERYQELLDQKFISPAEYDRRETLYKAARDKVSALDSQLHQAQNQTAYTRLLADRNGIITARDVETGQVVGAGQAIVTLADLGEKEVAIDIPEQRVAGVEPAGDVTVELWADGGRRFKGRTREIAPSADPASRTYRVKVTLLEGKDLAQLGMTATVYMTTPKTDELAIPLAAVFSLQRQPAESRVWVVEETEQTVRSIPVELGVPVADERIVIAGLTRGQLIVTAGVSRLIEGQAVQLVEDAAGLAMQGGNPQESTGKGSTLIAGDLR
jgi:membrane fusion protein, multidrug efflux system